MSAIGHVAMADYAAERELLLNSLTRLLDEDDRVVGVWLRGSLGRGEEDDVSDIDLHVAVDDHACGAIVADIEGFLTRPGRPLLVQTVFSAPRGGFTRCVLYDGVHGPQQVDWMIWPQSVAVLHPPAHVLFVKAPIPAVASERYQTLVDESPGEAATPGHGQATCWLFVLIAARYLARGWDSAVLTMLRGCAQVAAAAGVADLPATPAEGESGTHADGLLREFSAGLRRAMPGSRIAGDFASPEAVDAIDRFVQVTASARGKGRRAVP